MSFFKKRQALGPRVETHKVLNAGSERWLSEILERLWSMVLELTEKILCKLWIRVIYRLL